MGNKSSREKVTASKKAEEHHETSHIDEATGSPSELKSLLGYKLRLLSYQLADLSGDDEVSHASIQDKDAMIYRWREALEHDSSEDIQSLIAEVNGGMIEDLAMLKGQDGSTALHLAARTGHLFLVKCLLGKLDDPANLIRSVDMYGRTILHLCPEWKYCHVEFIAVLSCYMDDSDWDKLLLVKDVYGKTALHYSVQVKHETRILHCILTTISKQHKDALIFDADESAQTALQIALNKGHWEHAKCIIKHVSDERRDELLISKTIYKLSTKKSTEMDTSVSKLVSPIRRHQLEHKLRDKGIDFLGCVGNAKAWIRYQKREGNAEYFRRYAPCKWSNLNHELVVENHFFDKDHLRLTCLEGLLDADCNGNTLLHIICMLRRYDALVEYVHALENDHIEHLFVKKNKDGLQPSEMALATEDLVRQYVGYEPYEFVYTRGGVRECSITQKVINVQRSCYIIPRFVPGKTEKVFSGCALFISNSFVLGSHGYRGDGKDQRRGWDEEQGYIIQAMNELNFKVTLSNDLTAEKMKTEISSFCRSANHPLVFIFLMSHGGNSSFICGNDGKEISIEDLAGAADTKNLKGQPKAFFVQCCRGVKKSSRLDVRELVRGDWLDDPKEQLPEANKPRTSNGITAPGPDFLICLSTLSTEMARRGLFMKILSRCLIEMSDGNRDITEIIREVNIRLGREANGQCVEYISTLKHLKL